MEQPVRFGLPGSRPSPESAGRAAVCVALSGSRARSSSPHPRKLGLIAARTGLLRSGCGASASSRNARGLCLHRFGLPGCVRNDGGSELLPVCPVNPGLDGDALFRRHWMGILRQRTGSQWQESRRTSNQAQTPAGLPYSRRKSHGRHRLTETASSHRAGGLPGQGRADAGDVRCSGGTVWDFCGNIWDCDAALP